MRERDDKQRVYSQVLPTCATPIHFSMIRALCAGVDGGPEEEEVGLGSGSEDWHSRDMMTWLVMALNCVMVALMVGDMFSFLTL